MSLNNIDALIDKLLLDRIRDINGDGDKKPTKIEVAHNIINNLVKLFGRDKIIGNIVLYNVIVGFINSEKFKYYGKDDVNDLERRLINIVSNYYKVVEEYPEVANYLLFEIFNSKKYLELSCFEAEEMNIYWISKKVNYYIGDYFRYVDASGIVADIFIDLQLRGVNKLIATVLISCNSLHLFKIHIVALLRPQSKDEYRFVIQFNRSLSPQSADNFTKYFHSINYYFKRYDFVKILANIFNYINNVLKSNYGVSMQKPNVLLERIKGVLAETINDSSR